MTDRPPADGAGGVAVLDPATSARLLDARSAIRLCPYLSSPDGDWRSAIAVRDHRCTAVHPAATLSLEKQRRLCLADEHRTCATYLAARRTLAGETERHDEPGATRAQDREDAPGPPERPVVRWALPRTAPVVLDRGRPSLRALLAHRSITQLGLVLLMALAFLVLALARLSASGDGGVLLSSPSGTSQVSAAPSSPASVSLTAPAVAASELASLPLASTATASGPTASRGPSPAASRRYRVVAGDTLSGIAARFGVSLRALQQANGISDPSRLRVGTVLVIP